MPAAMREMPGYFWGISYFLGAIIFSLMSKGEVPWKRKIPACTVLPVLAAMFLFLTNDRPQKLYVLFLGLALLCTFTILALASGYKLSDCLFLTMASFILGEFNTALAWHFALYLAGGRPESVSIHLTVICFSTVSLLVYGAVGLREKHFFTVGKLPPMERAALFSALLATLGVFLFSNLSNVFRNTPFSGQTAFQINLIHVLVDLGGLFLLDAWRFYRISLARREEADLLRTLMETQYANYKLSEQSMELINQKYHDLKHQIALLRKDMPDGERTAWLDDMENEIRAFEAVGHTGNHVVDTILAAKTLQCQRMNIRLTGVVEGKLLDFMSVPDTSALLGNLLDNAIESTDRIGDAEKRWIQFSVTRRKGFVILETGNHYLGDISFLEGLPVTTKSDSRYHGYGTRSIRMIASRYGGNVCFTAEDGWFTTKVLFPDTPM